MIGCRFSLRRVCINALRLCGICVGELTEVPVFWRLFPVFGIKDSFLALCCAMNQNC